MNSTSSEICICELYHIYIYLN